MKQQELRITEIEFDLVKQNFKNFLKSQNEFTGYNFEGSAINILLDILAYNTYYQAFYNNMTINEMFLDSAIKRSSIVSIAKHFAYRPKSLTSSRCQVQVTTTDTGRDLIPRGTRILATKNGESFSFYVPEDVRLFPITYSEAGVVTELGTDTFTLVQGILRKYSFVADSSNSLQRYVIPFKDIDSTTLYVTVQPNSSTNTFEKFIEATNIVDVKPDSNVYYLEENADGYMELIFGDGVLGRRLNNGNIVRVEVAETVGSAGNQVGTINSENTFSGPQGFTSGTTTVIVPSNGGSDRESKESIRFNISRNYVSQNRAVTKEDYRNVILKDYSNLEDVICWGGEDNDPIQYGKVFISVKPKDGVFLSPEEKSKIIQTITKTRNVVGVLVEFVDPEILYLNLTLNVKIDPINIPMIGMEQLLSNIQETTYSFTDQYLNRFDKDFYANDLNTQIQSIDENIITSNVSVSIEKRFTPLFNLKPNNYVFKFNNKLFHPQDGFNSILSTNIFGYLDNSGIDRDCELEDDGYGNVVLFYRQNENKVVINSKIGTIDYNNGVITLNRFKPSSLIDQKPISLYCVPNENDIIAKQKMFLVHERQNGNSFVLNTTLIPYKNR